MKTFLKILAWIFGIALAIFISLVIYVAINFGPDTTTDVDDYESLLANQFKDSILITPFPKTIPANATDVRLSYSSGFLQGGGHLQLRFSLPEPAFQNAIQPFIGKELLSFKGGNTNTHKKVHTTFPYTFSEDVFPDDYTVLLLYIRPSLAEAEKMGPNFYWNHGDNYGVVYSDASNTIVFWAEFW
jgi:hypothetical protein